MFSGTTCIGGEARALVYATGMRTELGRIAALSERVEQELSPLELQVRRVAWLIALVAVVAGLAFLPIGWLAAGLPLRDSFTFAVGLIVANVPEGLLPTITLSLAVGVAALARRGALVKRLSAIETLGSTTVICTDKTGTLTENRMRPLRVWTPLGELDLENRAEGAPVPVADDPVLALLARTIAACSTAELDPQPDREVHAERRRRWGSSRPRGRSGSTSTCGGASSPGGRSTDSTRSCGSCRPSISGRTAASPSIARARRKKYSTRCGSIGGRENHVRSRTRDRERCSPCSTLGETGTARARRRATSLTRCDSAAGTREEAERGSVPPRARRSLRPAPPGGHRAVERCQRRDPGDRRDRRLRADRGGDRTQGRDRHQRRSRRHRRRARPPERRPARRLAALQRLRDLRSHLPRGEAPPRRRPPRRGERRGHDRRRRERRACAAPRRHRNRNGTVRDGRRREASTMVLTDDNFATIVAAVAAGRRVFANVRKFVFYILAHTTPEVVPFLVFALSGGAIPLPLTVMQILAIDLGTEILPALALGRERPSRDCSTDPHARGGRASSTVSSSYAPGRSWAQSRRCSCSEASSSSFSVPAGTPAIPSAPGIPSTTRTCRRPR